MLFCMDIKQNFTDFLKKKLVHYIKQRKHYDLKLSFQTFFDTESIQGHIMTFSFGL